VSHGERRVSHGRAKGERLVARVHADLRWVPKWTPFLYAIFGRPPAQQLRLALVNPTDRYLRAWKPVPSCLQFDQQLVLFPLLLPPSPSFSLLLPPSPSFSLFQRPPFPPSWRNEKPRLSSWELEPNPTAIREGHTERKTALETMVSSHRSHRDGSKVYRKAVFPSLGETSTYMYTSVGS
jgi:hypothetical protein